MRTACLVVVGYVLAVLSSALWPALPPPLTVIAGFSPCVASISATYLGFSSRDGVIWAAAASAVVGYLSDVATGVTPGMSSTPAVIVALLAASIHARITMRRPWWIGGVCVAATCVFYLAQGVTLSVLGVSVGDHAQSWTNAAGIALITGGVAPVAFAAFRRVDAALSRTVRDREAVLEGRL